MSPLAKNRVKQGCNLNNQFIQSELYSAIQLFYNFRYNLNAVMSDFWLILFFEYFQKTVESLRLQQRQMLVNKFYELTISYANRTKLIKVLIIKMFLKVFQFIKNKQNTQKNLDISIKNRFIKKNKFKKFKSFLGYFILKNMSQLQNFFI